MHWYHRCAPLPETLGQACPLVRRSLGQTWMPLQCPQQKRMQKVERACPVSNLKRIPWFPSLQYLPPQESIACNCAVSHLLGHQHLSNPGASHLPATRVHTSQPNTVTFWEPYKGSHKHTSFPQCVLNCVLPKRHVQVLSSSV